MREKIHDEIAQKDGALKKCLNNIELLKKYNIPVEIKTIIMKKIYIIGKKFMNSQN